jgi:hypothetical protein
LFRSALLISSPLRDYSGNPKPFPDPAVLAQEVVEDLEAAVEQFREIASDLGGEVAQEKDESGYTLNVWNCSPPFSVLNAATFRLR